MSNLRPFLIALSLAMLAGCTASHPPRADVAAAQAGSGPAANDNLNAVAWTQGAIEHDLVYREVYRHAGEQLLRALADQDWDALPREEREGAVRGLAPAVILDIDETVLDNSPYQARLIRDGKEYDEISWDQWVAEKKAKPLPGVVDFARAAAEKGVTILYISNRAVHLKDATLANLREAGLPVADDSVFLGLGTVLEGCEQNGSEKNCRRRLAGQQYRVLMQFGDQIGDFVQVEANTRDGRQALFDEYDDWFGERWWMLPNPTYGSWEPALFNNAWDQPPAARTQAKRDALDYAP